MERLIDTVFNEASSLAGPVAVFLVSLRYLRRRTVVARLFASVLFAAATFVFFAGGTFAWAMRAIVLAPGAEAIPRHSPEAMGRFLSGLLENTCLSLCIAGIGIFVYWLDRRETVAHPR